MTSWKPIFQKISLALFVIFILQISLPTVSYAFSGFFGYSAQDGKLRGYVYVKDPTKVKVDVMQNGSVTSITYDGDKVKESNFYNPYYWYDDLNQKLKNVNITPFGYISSTAPTKIVASDGLTSQEFTKVVDVNGDVRYFGDNTRLGYYRITGKQYLSALDANHAIAPYSDLVSFTPASTDSNAIQLDLPKVDNQSVIDFTKLAVSDFKLRDDTTGNSLTITNINRISGYEQLVQHPNIYLNSIVTLETSEFMIKDHSYTLSLSSSSSGNELKLPVEGIYSFDLTLGYVKGQYTVEKGNEYFFEGHNATYFDNVQLRSGPQLKSNAEYMAVGQEIDFKLFNKFADGSSEEATNYEIFALVYSNPAQKAISFDSTTKKITALNQGAATFALKYNGATYAFTVTVSALNVGGGGGGPVLVPGTGGGGYFQFSFEDQDLTRGQIHPKISWATSSEPNYSGYELTFSDINKAAIGQSRSVTKQEAINNQYKVDIPTNTLPSGAVFVNLFPKDLSGQIGSEVYTTQIYDNTSNSPILPGGNSTIPAPVLRDVSFKDQDTKIGTLAGTILWYDASTEPSPATSYSLYFVDANNAKLKPIAEIPKTNLRRIFQGVDLPSYEVIFPSGYPMPSGAQRIGIYGKNEQGESSQGTYFGFWDITAGTLGNDYFEDADNRAGHINGTLRWAPMLNEANIVSYVVQFLGTLFEPLGTPFAKLNKGQQQYSVSMQGDQIPANAKLIELRARNADGQELLVGRYTIADNVLGEVPSSTFVEQLPGMIQTRNTDLDGEAGEIGGDVYFFADFSTVNTPISRYDVYFTNDQLKKIKPILSLPRNNVGEYHTSIPMNTQIPDGATKLAIYGVTPTGESLPTIMNLEDRIYSHSLLLTQINITNNKSDKEDSITITGLQEYDVVSVYREANSINPFLTGSVLGQNASSITFIVPQLGTEAGSLYVALQRNNGTRSLKVKKDYDKEPAPAGGGGGGGGGGGPAESFKWDIVNQNGNIRITSSVDAVQLKKLAEEQAKSGNREITIDVKTNADGYDFQITAGLLEEVTSKQKDAVLVFNTTVGTARIPFALLQEAVDANGGTDAMSLKISVDGLRVAEQQALEKTIATNGGSSVGKALSYELTLMDSNKTVANIDTFSEFVGHVILLPKDLKLNPGEKLNGAVWDPSSNTLISVPMSITLDKEGKPAIATLWRKGNSIYTVYKAKKQFADVQNDYFAKADIESLAASGVIQGFEDGSFRAEASVTRAEFATLLVRGLGLKTTNSALKDFTDVNDKDWFSQAVYTAVGAGLIHGYEDGTFRPTQSITHQEAVTMISNALKFINATTKLNESERTKYVQRMKELSLQVDEWASDATALALKLNILNVSIGFSFGKDAATTRGQTAVLLNKLLQNAAWPAN
ncbi:S-layer homology domain-containing protein [Paenibacillus sp. Soil750]|uniref:S-layer homology domain-containing protein n=1 Tax=Paenibacillus sp. Soil750 TaxID=1736398 RepID=UPI0006FCA25C|nr:S-layer homology domain-containing protein [Paenibacillus sp. Soil750]KRE72012.1 hypothetical protein ASL11_09570 [Paenibacillus sp. Soil750]